MGLILEFRSRPGWPLLPLFTDKAAKAFAAETTLSQPVGPYAVLNAGSRVLLWLAFCRVDRADPRGLRDPLGLRESLDRPDPRDLLDPLDLPDPRDLPDPLGQPARPDRRARRVTPARHRQFGSSLVRIAFAAETTKSWLVLFARAARPTERSAPLPAPQ
jgi:hypothetical protein